MHAKVEGHSNSTGPLLLHCTRSHLKLQVLSLHTYVSPRSCRGCRSSLWLHISECLFWMLLGSLGPNT